MGLWDASPGGARPKRGRPRLAVPGARAPRSPCRRSSGSSPTGAGSVCYRAAAGAAFRQPQERRRRPARRRPRRARTSASRTDSFGFTWLTVTGDPDDTAGLCTDLHAVNTTLEAQGFGPGCSARWSRSPTPAAAGSGWSTSTSRAPSTRSRPTGPQQRDNLLEIQVRDAARRRAARWRRTSAGGSRSGMLRDCDDRRGRSCREQAIEAYDVLGAAPSRAGGAGRAGRHVHRRPDGHDQPDHRHPAAPGRDVRLRGRGLPPRGLDVPRVLDDGAAGPASPTPASTSGSATTRSSTGEIGRRAVLRLPAARTPDGVVIGTLCVFDEEPRTRSTRAASSAGRRSPPASSTCSSSSCHLRWRGCASCGSNERLGALRRPGQPRPQEPAHRDPDVARAGPRRGRPTDDADTRLAARAGRARGRPDARDDRRPAGLRPGRRRAAERGRRRPRRGRRRRRSRTSPALAGAGQVEVGRRCRSCAATRSSCGRCCRTWSPTP